MTNIYMFSGQLNVGKDHVAHLAGLHVITLPEPIYKAVRFFLGDDDKKKPHVRRAVQLVGAWGRGVNEGTDELVNDHSRNEVVSILRNNGRDITGVDLPWEKYGKDGDLWINHTVKRLRETAEQGIDCVMPNMRFQREKDILRETGARHVHVMCREEERRRRMKRPFDPAIDLTETEMYVYHLSRTILEKGVGAADVDAVVWNDKTPPPDKKMRTMDMFLHEVESARRSDQLHPRKSPSVIIGREPGNVYR